jgi:hypothetical protein
MGQTAASLALRGGQRVSAATRRRVEAAAARLGYRPVVLERELRPGGMLVQAIPAYRLPRAILDAETARLATAGVTFEFLPQRTLTRALWATLAGVLACLAIVAGTRRRTSEVVPDLPDARPLRLAWLASPMVGTLTALFVSPRYGLLALVIVAVLPRLPERPARLAGPILVATGLTWGAVLLVAGGTVPSFVWPRAAEPGHRLVLLGVVIAAFSTALRHRTEPADTTTSTEAPPTLH